jgi:hypothetical protein
VQGHKYFCKKCGREHAETFRGKKSKIFAEHSEFAETEDKSEFVELLKDAWPERMAEAAVKTGKGQVAITFRPTPMTHVDYINLKTLKPNVGWVKTLEGTFVVVRDELGNPITLVPEAIFDTPWRLNAKLERMVRYNGLGERIERELRYSETLLFDEQIQRAKGKGYSRFRRWKTKRKLKQLEDIKP